MFLISYRCVVSSLTEEGPSDLADELIKGEALQIDENTFSDDEDANWENWVPDPVDADPSNVHFYLVLYKALFLIFF